MKKSLLAAAAAVLAAAAAVPAAAAEDLPVRPAVTSLSKVPTNVMIIGNSYTYYNCGVFDYMFGFAADRKVDIKTAQATIAGADLDWQPVEALINPKGDSHKFYKRNKDGVLFDTVLLQPNSMSPVDPKRVPSFRKYAAEHVATIRKAGGEPALVLTWARKGKPEMTAQLAESVIKTANELKVLVIPVGLAFAEAQKQDPSVELIMPDKSHPTAAGSYLESAVIFSALTHASLEGSHYYGGCEKSLNPKTAAFLQKVSWETVKSFYGWK
jgi:hypothetical protein